ncbi:hypothetical protein [Massilia sp. HP4]|uniref:hypothetical protein n=1 Tax=Massilia sp. HP4 TaxID=2562316 RepID=UPI0010BFA4EE|nr:hypothetical protein [Massilia sp. HP4]
MMSHASTQHHFLCLLLALGILLCVRPAMGTEAPESGKGTSIIGDWKIRSVLDYAAISIGSDQAKPLIGKDLIISKEEIRFGDQVCSQSNFLAESVETNIELGENARVSNDLLRLPNPVTVVELSCAYAYIKDSNQIVLAWNGGFFDAVRKTRSAAVRHARRDSAIEK